MYSVFSAGALQEGTPMTPLEQPTCSVGCLEDGALNTGRLQRDYLAK